ncbi:MAG: imidazole glycerol phosphate synthase subunit HisF [Candidatus Omnitrophica bacterium]|nr:imidazole glycerol phosphate synthase subunit HisF [Candidatus Omnitrophota bacterium]
MKKMRIIPRLDVKGPNVVKGIQLEGLRVVGKPSDLARKYYNEGADELIYIDIVASLYGRNNLAHIIEETIKKDVFIPITVGGGIRSVEDIDKILRSGADKVAINTAAVRNPELLKEAVRVFGSSTIVLSVEAKKISDGKWEAYVDNGRERTGLDVIDWIKKAVGLGVGEILVTSVDRDGTRLGFDGQLIDAVTSVVSVPVIASGGAGEIGHVAQCMENKKLDGIAIASMFHYGECTVGELKEKLSQEHSDRIKRPSHRDRFSEDKVDANVSIVDYRLGNLCSVTNAFRQIGANPRLIDTPQQVLDSRYLVLPGVGSFEEGMKHLRKNNLDQAIAEYVNAGKPLLGICLGMQLLMTKSSEFGEYSGLDLIEGEVLKFEENISIGQEGYKIPHVGWNSVFCNQDWNGTILEPLEDDMGAYFVHSYYVQPRNRENILAVTDYFGHQFCSVIRKGNVYGCQFHPEKSGQEGLAILRAFVKIRQKEGVLNVR